MGMIFKFDAEESNISNTKKRYCKKRHTKKSKSKAVFKSVLQSSNAIINLYK